MERCIGKDEIEERSREEKIREIDGDEMIKIRIKKVKKKWEIKIIIGGEKIKDVVFKRGKMVIKDEISIIKKKKDKGRFEVIEGKEGEKEKKGFVLMIGKKIGKGSVIMRRIN